MAWQDDYYLGSSDYPRTGADDFILDALDAGGHLADDVAVVVAAQPPPPPPLEIRTPIEDGLAATLVSDDPALD